MPWTWIQSTGEMLGPDGTLFAKGYAGAPGHVNDPSAQDIPNTGPLPAWTYEIGEPYSSPETGPYTLSLNPTPSPLPDGRDGFKIHGDSVNHPGCASEGCIVLSYTYRVEIWTSLDHTLVVVKEPPQPIT